MKQQVWLPVPFDGAAIKYMQEVMGLDFDVAENTVSQ
jgi:hypothetical protein